MASPMAVPHSEWIRYVIANRLWGDSDICLVDVGASGGIHTRWSAFGTRLTAVGFDPLVSEVSRLNELETRPKVRYEAAHVGSLNYDELSRLRSGTTRSPAASISRSYRSSAVAAHRLLSQDYVRDVFNAGSPVEYSSRWITLDTYLSSVLPVSPDFLKIDTDGNDYAVLLGAAKTIQDGLLGISVECQFHGAVHPFANSFSNIDRYLRERGFSIFDLTLYRYSRSALPAPFLTRVPAQTLGGQLNWGKALYFRDLAEPSYERMFGIAPTRERLLKLCCLFALYELDDCAAEVLVTSDALSALPERTWLLDALTPRVFGDETYDAYISRFNGDPSQWLSGKRSERARARAVDTSADADERIAQLKSRVVELKRQNIELRQRLRKRKERLASVLKKKTDSAS